MAKCKITRVASRSGDLRECKRERNKGQVGIGRQRNVMTLWRGRRRGEAHRSEAQPTSMLDVDQRRSAMPSPRQRTLMLSGTLPSTQIRPLTITSGYSAGVITPAKGTSFPCGSVYAHHTWMSTPTGSTPFVDIQRKKMPAKNTDMDTRTLQWV